MLSCFLKHSLTFKMIGKPVMFFTLSNRQLIEEHIRFDTDTISSKPLGWNTRHPYLLHINTNSLGLTIYIQYFFFVILRYSLEITPARMEHFCTRLDPCLSKATLIGSVSLPNTYWEIIDLLYKKYRF